MSARSLAALILRFVIAMAVSTCVFFHLYCTATFLAVFMTLGYIDILEQKVARG